MERANFGKNYWAAAMSHQSWFLWVTAKVVFRLWALIIVFQYLSRAGHIHVNMVLHWLSYNLVFFLKKYGQLFDYRVYVCKKCLLKIVNSLNKLLIHWEISPLFLAKGFTWKRTHTFHMLSRSFSLIAGSRAKIKITAVGKYLKQCKPIYKSKAGRH